MFFDRWSWFKSNDSRLTIDMNVKFNTSVGKAFWRLVPTFVEVTGEDLFG